MGDELREILDDLLMSEDDAGCSGDLTVVSSDAICRLRGYLKQKDIIDA